MEHEDFGFVSRKMKKIIADFHVLRLLWLKNMIWAEKNICLSRAVAAAEISPDTSLVPKKTRKLKFWLS
jgi:hypothetical protein